MIAGVNEMLSKMRGLRADYNKSAERSVNKFGNVEMREMKKLVPIDTGELRDSGFVKVEVQASLIRLIMGFSAHHAIFVHEDLEAFHRVGQAKYFEIPWNESSPFFLQRVAADIKKDLGL